MSVVATIIIDGDPAQLEAHATANPDAMRAVADRAARHGVIAHRFYGSDQGRIMAVDEWPDEQSFQSFFQEAAPEIQAILQAVGVTSEPEVTFWHKLDTQDEVGWES